MSSSTLLVWETFHKETNYGTRTLDNTVSFGIGIGVTGHGGKGRSDGKGWSVKWATIELVDELEGRTALLATGGQRRPDTLAPTTPGFSPAFLA